MDVAEALLGIGEPVSEASFARFAESLDPAWVEQALQATGTATLTSAAFSARAGRPPSIP